MRRSRAGSQRSAPATTVSREPSAPATAVPREPSAPAAARRPRPDFLALALVVLAVLLRLPHLDWGLPEPEEEAMPMKHAFAMWGWEDGHVVLDPGRADWPSLSFYVHLLLQHLHYWVGRAIGMFADRNDYFVASWLDMGPLYVLSRLLGVAAAAAIVWNAARLARRLAGAEGALLAGGLLALSPQLLEYAQLVTPDILLALFAALAVGRIVDIHQRGRRADYLWAGVWIGLGISSKYTPGLLLPAVFVAHALRGARQSPARALFALRPWLAVLMAVVAFAATSPFLFLDLQVSMRDVAGQSLHMTAGHFGNPAWAFFYVTVLAHALGWSGLLLALAGLAWACVRERGPWLVLAACALSYYLGLAVLKTQFPRYMLPLLMPIAVGLSGVVLALRSHRSLGAGAPRALATGLVAIAAFAPAAFGSWRYHVEKPLPTTHQLANRFLRQAAAAGSPRIAAEVLSISLPRARSVDLIQDGVLRNLSATQRARVLARPVYDVDLIPMYSVRPELSAFYYDLRHYTAYDYIVVSQGVRGRYQVDPRRFPTQVRFYDDLDRYGKLVGRFGPHQRATGAEIRIYRIPREGVAALLRDRGELVPDPSRAGPLNPPDYMLFVESVARAAYAHGQWAMAERYYRLMWDAATPEVMDEGQRAELARVLESLRGRAANVPPAPAGASPGAAGR